MLSVPTNQPSYASGSRVSSGGYNGSGGLQVLVGGINEIDVTNMSGAWRRSFTLAQAKDIEVSFRYRLDVDAGYDADELSQALFAVDGTLIGLGGQDYLVQLVNGTPQTSGWQAVTLDLGQLSAGSHVLEFGAFNSKKTTATEQTTFVVDEVLVTAEPAPNAPPVLDPLPDLGAHGESEM